MPSPAAPVDTPPQSDALTHGRILTMPHSHTAVSTPLHLIYWQRTPPGTLLCILHTQSIVDVQVETFTHKTYTVTVARAPHPTDHDSCTT